MLTAHGRAPESIRRSVELDVVLGHSRRHAMEALERFRVGRGLASDDPLLGTVLAGTADVVGESIARYQHAGVTDLMLGFTDFPATTMLEAFAERVLPQLSRRGPRRPPPMPPPG
jgi:alkanesulfonate monooxygenase SsuD/methylene tetrahydromethanopterin reductase-like flavin-dependent oxidoreductase (luciferase family)